MRGSVCPDDAAGAAAVDGLACALSAGVFDNVGPFDPDRVDVLVVARAARLGEGTRGGKRQGEHGKEGGNQAAFRHERGF